jgi:hypothetical protein
MNSNTKIQHNDEWQFKELKNLLKVTYAGFLAIFHFIIKAYHRYAMVAIAVAVVISAWQYYRYTKKTPYYENKASYVYYDLHKKNFGEMIEELNHYLNIRDFKQVAHKLNIPVEEANKIIECKALNLYGSNLSEDITESKHPFYVVVKTKDSQTPDSLSYHIKAYFNSNPLYVAEIGVLKKEKEFIDTLKAKILLEPSAYLFSKSNNSSIAIADLIQKSLDISDKIIDKENSAVKITAVALLTDFKASPVIIGIDKKKTLIKTILLIMVFATISVTCIAILKQK